MKNPFKKEPANFQSAPPITPYQLAKQEWDDRIGSARVQARNWRFLAFVTLFLAIGLLAILLLTISGNKPKLFVAEVSSNGRVVDVMQLQTRYQPTVAQEEYFLAHFVNLIRGLPLDPVVAKKNWLEAYNFLSARGAERLSAYFRQNNPVELLGKKTVTITITTVNPISDKSFAIEWSENTVNLNGQNEGQKNYSGVFTIVIKQPTTQREILQNPLGILIVDFSFSPRTG
jgi:type IV secretion system protein TrbF